MCMSRCWYLSMKQTHLTMPPAGPPWLVDICDSAGHRGELTWPHSCPCSELAQCSEDLVAET